MSQTFTHLVTSVVFSTKDMINEVFNRAMAALDERGEVLLEMKVQAEPPELRRIVSAIPLRTVRPEQRAATASLPGAWRIVLALFFFRRES